MTILIEDQQDKVAVNDNVNAILHRVVEMSFRLEGFQIPSEISFLLVDNDRIRELNKEYRKIDAPTDVLSFPMAEMLNGELLEEEGDYDLDEEQLMLGDIVISLQKAVEQAEEYGHSFDRELAFLAAHGVYHLLGYDHMQEDDEKRMIEKQESVLSQLGLFRQ